MPHDRIGNGVQQMFASVSLWISCTTTKKWPNLFCFPLLISSIESLKEQPLPSQTGYFSPRGCVNPGFLSAPVSFTQLLWDKYALKSKQFCHTIGVARDASISHSTVCLTNSALRSGLKVFVKCLLILQNAWQTLWYCKSYLEGFCQVFCTEGVPNTTISDQPFAKCLSSVYQAYCTGTSGCVSGVKFKNYPSTSMNNLSGAKCP